MAWRDVSRNPNIAREDPPPPLYEELPPHGVLVDGPGMPGVPPPGFNIGMGMGMGMGVPMMPPPPYPGLGFGMGMGVGMGLPNPFHPVPSGFIPPPPPFVAGIASPPAFATPGFAWARPPAAVVSPAPAPVVAAPVAGPILPPVAPGVVMPPMGFMGGMGMGMGMSFGAPMNGDFGPVPPEQTDMTQFPGGRIWGITSVESNEHAIVGWIQTYYPPWVMQGQMMTVEWLHVDSGWSLNRLIRAMRNNAPPAECIGWAVSECIELGSGTWQQGTTFVFNSPVSMHQGLSDVGWDKKRNRNGEQSLHVYLHRV